MGRPKGSTNKKQSDAKSKPKEIVPINKTIGHPNLGVDEGGETVLDNKHLTIEDLNTAYGVDDKQPFGIILVALGHPMYAHQAYNLAVSLKSHGEIPITIVKQDSAFSQLEAEQKKIFDTVIDCKEEWITGKYGEDFFKVKIHLDEITTYKRTLYLDVDMVWNNRTSPTQVFDQLDGLTFTTCNRGRVSTIDGELKSRWVSMSDLKQYYNLDYVYDVSSEFMYFEYTNVFKVAREIYESNEMPINKFGSGLPDEVWIEIAIEKTGTRLHEDPFMPTYWQPFYFNKFHNDEFILNHFALSIGGAFIHPKIEKLYNHITQSHFTKMRLKRVPYPAMQKSKVLKERRLI